IRAGVYNAKFSILSYKTVIVEEVTIYPDLRNRLDVELEPAAIELEPITIKAERPLIQRDLAATAYWIGETKLEELPITRFEDVLSLQPGITLEGNVRGGKTNDVAFFVDGLPVQDVIGGGLGTSLPRRSISGLTIYTGGFDSEYGNALSGVVNVVTRSGGDTHSFEVRLEKDDWLPEKWNEKQDGATGLELSASGPLVPEKVSYFTSNTVSTTDTRWWQDFRRFFLSPVSQDVTGFTKLEYIRSSRTRLSGQGIYSFRKWHDYEFSWRFNLSGLPVRKRDSYRVAVMLSHMLTDKSFFNISLSRFFLRSRIGDGFNEEILEPFEFDMFLRYIIGGRRNWFADTRQIIYTFKGDFNLQFAGQHFIKLGAELNFYDIFSDVIKLDPQTTYFGKPIIDASLLNYSNNYRYFPRTGSIYLQDKIDIVREGSKLSFGVRWDFLDPRALRPIVEFIPTTQGEYDQQVVGSTSASFKQQLSPRIAFAAPIGPMSFFFANFGYYFQFPLFDYLYSGISPSQLRFGAKNVLVGNPDLEPERTESWELGLKHGIRENLLASATYFRKEFKNQIDAKTLIPFDSKAAGDFGFASYVNVADASASGIEFILDLEQNKRISGSISYTYMTTEGVSEQANQAINYAQWGFPLPARPFPLSWDQRHTIKVDALVNLAWGFDASVVVLYNSPRPYTFYPTRDGFTPSDTSKVLIPNNARMREVTIVNVKITRLFEFGERHRYKVTVFMDGRNLLDTRNIRWMDSNGRIGGELGDPSAYYDLQRIRIGARFQF
ncbi:MAG: TonB-dependent receptor plug domain-containing protein, partial [Bacteroidota bacterium]